MARMFTCSARCMIINVNGWALSSVHRCWLDRSRPPARRSIGRPGLGLSLPKNVDGRGNWHVRGRRALRGNRRKTLLQGGPHRCASREYFGYSSSSATQHLKHIPRKKKKKKTCGHQVRHFLSRTRGPITVQVTLSCFIDRPPRRWCAPGGRGGGRAGAFPLMNAGGGGYPAPWRRPPPPPPPPSPANANWYSRVQHLRARDFCFVNLPRRKSPSRSYAYCFK